jgi:hypothetical protein
VSLVKTEVWRNVLPLSERETGIGELETMLAVSSSLILFTLMMISSEMSVLTRATQRHIPEDGILLSHCRKNLKSYNFMYLTSYIDILVEIEGHVKLFLNPKNRHILHREFDDYVKLYSKIRKNLKYFSETK